VPPTKAKTYGQYKYACAGAKQSSNGAVKNNYFAPSRCPLKRNCCLDFPQLDQKLRNAAHSVAMSTTWVIIGPTLWPFVRANPRRQRYARFCRNMLVLK